MIRYYINEYSLGDIILLDYVLFKGEYVMRNKAYRYYQNKKHNDRTASNGSHCGSTYHRTVKRINRPHQPSEGINWKTQDLKSIDELKSQIEESNGKEKYHKPIGRNFPKYMN